MLKVGLGPVHLQGPFLTISVILGSNYFTNVPYLAFSSHEYEMRRRLHQPACHKHGGKARLWGLPSF